MRLSGTKLRKKLRKN